MPVGVFLKYKDQLDEVHVVNDYPYSLGTCTVSCHLKDNQGKVLFSKEVEVEVPEDCNLTVFRFEDQFPKTEDCVLEIKRGDEILSHNEYHKLFHMPEHVKGHPERMDHELGCRLYFAE